MTAATVYRVVFACVPDQDLNANARVHHMRRYRKSAQLRQFIGWSAREYAPAQPFTGPVEVQVSIGWPSRRQRQDPSNVSHCLKAVIDGMTDAGWWPDDTLVTLLPVRQQVWSEWRDVGGTLYPHGVMTVDVEEVLR